MYQPPLPPVMRWDRNGLKSAKICSNLFSVFIFKRKSIKLFRTNQKKQLELVVQWKKRTFIGTNISKSSAQWLNMIQMNLIVRLNKTIEVSNEENSEQPCQCCCIQTLCFWRKLFMSRIYISDMWRVMLFPIAEW